ncbi:MAG: 1-acyl-sn-glycerol-3-phosphate acyltransferase [Anaerolineales bacterium]|nr:1-acyl-sn-glycerol-3-phosphate acyltransferase [Anaerolineales bacterium]
MNEPASQPKPITDWWKPELVALPKLTARRRLFRRFFRLTTKAIALFTMRTTVRGLENFPTKGPAIIVFNHLGDWDAILLAATIPISAECIGKIELNEHWLAGPAFRAYGFIWIHRGQPDRRAMRAALDALSQGRMLALAPEGRQTVTGGLEEGTEGAAFLAMKSGAPIVPVGLTGTENAHIGDHVNTWKRAPVSLSVGKPFSIEPQADRQETIRNGTRQIMEALARLLPPERQGVFSYVSPGAMMES